MIHSSILRRQTLPSLRWSVPKSGCPRRRRTRPACFAVPRLMRSAGCSATRGCDVAETDVHGFSEPASAKDYCTYLSDGGPRPRCRWAGRRRRHGTWSRS